ASRQAHQDDVAANRRDGRGQSGRFVAADEVENYGGPRMPGRLGAYVSHRVLSGRDHDMSARSLGERARLRAGIDRDDAGSGESAEHLDGHVTEPADTDHHGGAARSEMRHRVLDGVVWREAGVRQWSRRNGIEIPDRDEEPLRGDGEVLRETAVASESATMGAPFFDPFADVLHPLCTSPARAAAPRAVDDYCLALGHAGHARSDGSH